MKKRLFSALALFIFCSVCYAQVKIEKELMAVLNRRSSELININIVFKSQINAQDLKTKTLNIVDREIKKGIIINELKEHSKITQANVLELLKAEEAKNCVTNISCHWITNSICCDASREVIYKLSEIEDINIIGINPEVLLLTNNNSLSVIESSMESGNATPHILQINADDVWELGYTGKNVVVAVLDSGTNFDHYDLKDHLWIGYADTDGDGNADDIIYGWNFATKDTAGNSNIRDDYGHGTHCAGIVCGDGSSGNTTGVAPDASLMTVKIVNRSGGGTPEQMISGVEFAIENGANILSMSLGFKNNQIGDASKAAIRKTFENALEAGVIVCAAAGNDGNNYGAPNNVDIPANCPPPYIHQDQIENSGGLSSVVCVGAVDSNDNYASFSSQGPSTWQGSEWNDYLFDDENIGLIRPDIVAPGDMIYSLKHDTNNKYKFNSGTSQATPCVAGVMALMLEKNPTLTPHEICEIIETTAIKLSDKKNNLTGSGRIDALNAINRVEPNAGKPYVKLTNFSPIKTSQSSTINISLIMSNNGNSNCSEETSVTLSANDKFISIVNNSQTLGEIKSGEYKEIYFPINISNDTPNGHTVYFRLTTTDGENVWNDNFEIEIDASATILFNSKSVDTINAGEDVSFNVEMINSGTVATTNNSSVTLSSSSPYVTIINDKQELGTMNVGEKESVNFSVKIDKSIPNNSVVNFDLYATPNNFNEIKDIIYEFEIGKNSYGYYDDGLDGWTTFDASNDDRDHPWWHSSNYVTHKVENIGSSLSGKSCIVSEAYCVASMIEYTTPIDNYLVSPKIRVTNNSKFKFWIKTDEIFYSGQHFGVAISEESNNSAEDFITIKDWTITHESGKEWTEYSIDLGEYEGKDIYVAIRNFFTEQEWINLSNGYDLHLLFVDDVLFENVIDVSDNLKYNNYSYFSVKVKSAPIATPTNIVATAIDEKSISLSWNAVANVQNYNIYRNGAELIASVNGTTQYTDTNLKPNKEYSYNITAVLNNTESDFSEIVYATTHKADYNIAIKSVVYNEAMTIGENEIEITFVNDGKYDQQARSTITLSSEDEYITIITNNVNLNALDVDEEDTKTFTISLNEIPPLGYEVNINANITQKFEPFLSWDCPFTLIPNFTIGIEESENDDETLFAVVNGEILNINGIDGNAHISVYDISGVCIHNSTHSDSSTSINISKYNKGIYIVRVKDNNGIKSKKIYLK